MNLNQCCSSFVSRFNLLQSFNYAHYLFYKKRFKTEINCFCIRTLACCCPRAISLLHVPISAGWQLSTPIYIPVLRIRNVIPDPGSELPHPGSKFFHSGSEFFHPGSEPKNFSILTQNIVSKLSEMWSGLFIPDPDPGFGSWFLPIPDPGLKKAPDPGSATLLYPSHGIHKQDAYT